MREVSIEHVIDSMRPEPQVWQVITAQVRQGKATIYLIADKYLNEKYVVKFPDAPEPIPFEYLAYSSEIGLYDRRKFPNVK